MANRDASPKRKKRMVYLVLQETYLSKGSSNSYDPGEESSFDEKEPETEILSVFGSKKRAIAYCESKYKEDGEECKVHFVRQRRWAVAPEWVWKDRTGSGKNGKWVLSISERTIE